MLLGKLSLVVAALAAMVFFFFLSSLWSHSWCGCAPDALPGPVFFFYFFCARDLLGSCGPFRVVACGGCCYSTSPNNVHGCDHVCRRVQAPLGVTPATTADEVSRQLARLADERSGMTRDRLLHAAHVASPDVGGLTGDDLCSLTAEELLEWFGDIDLGTPPIGKSTITLIRRKLLQSALRVSPWLASVMLLSTCSKHACLC